MLRQRVPLPAQVKGPPTSACMYVHLLRQRVHPHLRARPPTCSGKGSTHIYLPAQVKRPPTYMLRQRVPLPAQVKGSPTSACMYVHLLRQRVHPHLRAHPPTCSGKGSTHIYLPAQVKNPPTYMLRQRVPLPAQVKGPPTSACMYVHLLRQRVHPHLRAHPPTCSGKGSTHIYMHVRTPTCSGKGFTTSACTYVHLPR